MIKENTISMINSLTVFKNLKNGAVLRGLCSLLSAEGVEQAVEYYSDFATALYNNGFNLSEYLLRAACEDRNIYSEYRAKKLTPPEVLRESTKCELRILEELSWITKDKIANRIGYYGYLPDYLNSDIDFVKEYEKQMELLPKTGYGIYAHNVMFRLSEAGDVEPVASPDTRSIDRLVGYESERQILVDNTRALVDGKPAANAFLYGDAGTGKSSTVKAVANMFASEGLRMVEIKKSQLKFLPSLMETLRDNPLKFIIFIDDITFSSVDDDFGMLKTMLEGSTSVKADNTVIYATSNRRHLVKESFADREGDDIHRNDTIQELMALSARFGLSILFQRPNKNLYIKIASELAKQKNINIDTKELAIRADAFALRKGGYTPRAAEQFVDSLVATSKSED